MRAPGGKLCILSIWLLIYVRSLVAFHNTIFEEENMYMKKIIALLLVLAMAMGLVACGSGSDKITLDVIMSQYGSYTQDWWTQFEKDFEAANTDIDLNVEIVSWNDIYSVVTTRISTNEQPDILNISGFADYVADDLLMPAEDYISEQVKNNFVPSFWEANEMDGTVWALPILASCRCMLVNTDLLSGAGITEAPKTWDDVLTACKAIKDTYGDEIIPWGLDISTDEGQAAFSYYSWNFGGGYTDESGNWALNTAENVKAVEYIKSLIDSGYVNANPYTDTRYPLQDAFSAGTLAMLIGPGNAVAADSKVNYEYAALPTATGTSVSLGVCDQFMVFKDEKAKDQDARTAAITKFFDAFYEKETYAGYMVYEGFLPATQDAVAALPTTANTYTKGGSDAKGDNDYFALFCPMVLDAKFYPMAKAEWMDVRNGVIDVEQQVCQGLKTAQEALDELQKSVTGG